MREDGKIYAGALGMALGWLAWVFIDRLYNISGIYVRIDELLRFGIDFAHG